MTRGDSSAAERGADSSRPEVAGVESCSPLLILRPPPRAVHTPGRLVAAPVSFLPLWGLYDDQRRCLGMIGAPGGNDAEIVEANARRVGQSWNNFDAMVGLIGDVATDVRLPAELRQRALKILANAGGLQ